METWNLVDVQVRNQLQHPKNPWKSERRLRSFVWSIILALISVLTFVGVGTLVHVTMGAYHSTPFFIGGLSLTLIFIIHGIGNFILDQKGD